MEGIMFAICICGGAIVLMLSVIGFAVCTCLDLLKEIRDYLKIDRDEKDQRRRDGY